MVVLILKADLGYINICGEEKEGSIEKEQMSNVMAGPTVIPLIIDGKDIILPSGARQAPVASPTTDGPTTFQGATKELALLAAESSARAFIGWSRTSAIERRGLLEALKEVRFCRVPKESPEQAAYRLCIGLPQKIR